MAQTNLFDPFNWLTSLQRSLKEYVEDFIDQYVLDAFHQPIGLDVYEVVMDFSEAAAMAEKMPLEKSIIHLEIDQITNELMGYGDGIVREYVDDNGDIREEEGQKHRVNFDVGTWSSDRSGGSTSRLSMYEMLTGAFHGPKATYNMVGATQGVKIVSWLGGRFIQETINDIPVFRTVDAELIVDVFSRKEVGPTTVVTDIDFNDGIYIGDELIVDAIPELPPLQP